MIECREIINSIVYNLTGLELNMLGSPILSGNVMTVPVGPMTVWTQFFLYSSNLACFSWTRENAKDEFIAANRQMQQLKYFRNLYLLLPFFKLLLFLFLLRI